MCRCLVVSTSVRVGAGHPTAALLLGLTASWPCPRLPCFLSRFLLYRGPAKPARAYRGLAGRLPPAYRLRLRLLGHPCRRPVKAPEKTHAAPGRRIVAWSLVC